MNLRNSNTAIRIASALLFAALFLGCQSDEEKLAEFFAKAQQYEEEEKHQEAVIEFKNVLKINPSHSEAHYALAKVYLKLGRARDAYWEMSETVRLDSSNAEAVLSFGALSLIAGDGEQALSMGDLAIKNEPENHQGYLLRANSLQKLKRNEEAEEPYLRALELDEESMDSILIVAKYYTSLPGGREKAEPWLWKGLEKYPNRGMRTNLARFLSADPKRFDEAEAMFKEALATEPRPDDHDKAFINIAQFYLSNGRNELGVKALEDGTKENPDSTELHFILANYYRINGNMEEAERLIRHASTIDPTDPTAFLVLSSFLGGKEDIEGALQAADDALAADSENTDAKLRRAELLVDIGFREATAAAESVAAEPVNELAKKSESINEGLKLADEILTASPFHPQAEFVRGKAYLARGDVAKGIEGFRAAAEGRPDWPQAHFALGSALASMNEPRLARVEIARALELDPGLHQARRILASIHQALGEHEYAIEQGSRFLQFQPEHNEARILVAQSLIRLGKRDQALRELNKVPLDQQDIGVLFALGRLNASLGDSDASRGYLLKVLEQSPNNEKVLRSLFRVDSDTEHYAKTRQRILDAAAALPDNGDLVQLEAMVKFIDRDLEGAEAGFKRSIELKSNDIEMHQQLARFYSLTGRTDETIATYKQAIEVKPNSAKLHHFLALLYEAQGERDKAQISYENAIKYDENHAIAKNNLAYLLADTGKDLDRALDLAQDAKALLPNDANAADTLGWVLYKRGVNGAAVGYLKESIEIAEADDPALGVMRHHLALAYEADGNKARAAEVLRAAIDDLDQRQRAAQKQDRSFHPPWEGEVRSMLERLSTS